MFQLSIFIKFEVSRNLPIYDPKPLLAGINSYAKFEENRSKTTQVRERKRTKSIF